MLVRALSTDYIKVEILNYFGLLFSLRKTFRRQVPVKQALSSPSQTLDFIRCVNETRSRCINGTRG